ncbi:MAG: hypothetical protein OCC49_05980 [Fibrobacterales bacterium]
MKKMIIALAVAGTATILSMTGCGGSAAKGGSSFRNGDYGLSAPQFTIKYPGSEVLIDYSKYGAFKNVGTKDYYFEITDKKGLMAASGTGIWPNMSAVDQEPVYQKLLKEGKIVLGTGTTEVPWSSNSQSNKAIPYFQWQKNSYSMGTRMMNMGNALRDAGHILHAIKTYYAHVVFHFTDMEWDPKGWWWSPAKVSADALEELIAKYPELGLEYTGATIEMLYTQDSDPSNDEVTCDPGELIGELVGKPIVNGVFVDERDKHSRDMALVNKPITIADPGAKFVIDFAKYGTLKNIKGTGAFSYTLKDAKGLAKAQGEGLYPNETAVKNNPQYNELNAAGWLIGHWKGMYYGSSTLDYYGFAAEGEESGNKLYFIGEALMKDAQRTKNTATAKHAVKAFYTMISLFPGTMIYGDETAKWVWAAGPVAIEKLRKLLNDFPELGLKLTDTVITIENGPTVDQNRDNDVVKVTLGKLVKK